MTRERTTPEQFRADAVQATLAMAKSTQTGNQRKADYYEGAADTLTTIYANAAGISLDQATDDIAADLEALEG